MNIPALTAKQYQRFQKHIAYARREGAALYNSQAPETILEGDDEVVEDAELIAARLLNRDDGYYTFTQHGWNYARHIHS